MPSHVTEHHPTRCESLQPHTERSSRPGPEPSSVEADVYVWHYTLLVVHVRKKEKEEDALTITQQKLRQQQGKVNHRSHHIFIHK